MPRAQSLGEESNILVAGGRVGEKVVAQRVGSIGHDLVRLAGKRQIAVARPDCRGNPIRPADPAARGGEGHLGERLRVFGRSGAGAAQQFAHLF